MQNKWIRKKVNYKKVNGPFTYDCFEPNDEELAAAMNEITKEADKEGWTVTALVSLPHERFHAGGVVMQYGITLVATLSKS